MANRKVLMCRPDHFDVTYDINHWMHDQIGQVDKSRAVTQWYELAFALSRVADVHMMNGVQDLPDLVFTANAGFIQGDMAVLSRFSTEERQPEEDVFAKWFLYHKYNLFRIASKYEGEGFLFFLDSSEKESDTGSLLIFTSIFLQYKQG